MQASGFVPDWAGDAPQGECHRRASAIVVPDTTRAEGDSSDFDALTNLLPCGGESASACT
jgi:hypothetical protein